MSKKPRTAKQLANDDRLRKMAADRKLSPKEEDEFDKTDFKESDDVVELKRQVQETRDLLKAFMAGKSSSETEGVSVGRSGSLVGEVDKYLVDPDNYPDPTSRLSQEPRLKAVNFDFDYELSYEVGLSSYETRTGVNMREPKFLIQLNRVKVDDQGNRTDDRYIARRLIFHEDPQAAMVIARDNGIEVDKSDEKSFLDEMRYLRVRDWLFGYFWPQATQTREGLREEVVGGTIVQMFTKSSEEPSEIEFGKIKNKARF